MGRRALRNPNPSLDLSGHFTSFDQLPRPWDAEALFGRRAPLEIDVGSGKGLFLRTAAARRPEVDFLGIEIGLKYAQFAAAGLARRRLRNALVVHGDAVRAFDELLPDAAAAAVHVYFPDPWWKKRHKKRRVLREAFLRQVERTLQPDGSVHFWTDAEEYFQTGLELFAQFTDLDGPLDVLETPAEHDMDYRSHFERRMRLHETPIFRAAFRKPSG